MRFRSALGPASLSVVAAIPCGVSSAHAQELVWKTVGNAAGDAFGYDAEMGGDIDRDGVLDVVVGAPYAGCNGAYSGEGSAVRGGDGSQILSVCGAPSSLLGVRVASAFDVDADGIDDILISAPFDDRAGVDAAGLR